MRSILSPLAPALGLVLLSTGAQAQAPARTPTHSIVRFFKCNPQGTGVRWFQQMRPIARQMVTEGKFLDYGLLQHGWGDEWNVVDYFTVDSLGAFFTHFSELVRRLGEANRQRPQGTDSLPPFTQVCTQHKDVIYFVVPPPAASNP